MNENKRNKAISTKKKKKKNGGYWAVENEFALSGKMHLTIDNMVIKLKCDINNILCRGNNNKIYCLLPEIVFFVLHGICIFVLLSIWQWRRRERERDMMPTKIIDHSFKIMINTENAENKSILLLSLFLLTLYAKMMPAPNLHEMKPHSFCFINVNKPTRQTNFVTQPRLFRWTLFFWHFIKWLSGLCVVFFLKVNLLVFFFLFVCHLDCLFSIVLDALCQRV